MEPEAAQQALAYIGSLYQIEKAAKKSLHSAEQLFAHRQKKSEPWVNAFFAWAYQQRQRSDLLPSNPLSTALAYAAKIEAELKVLVISGPGRYATTNQRITCGLSKMVHN